MIIALKYHHEIFDLLEIEAIIDSERFQILNQLESKHAIIIPDSVKEYFIIRNLIELLKEYNVFDNIVEFENFAEAETFEGLLAEDLSLIKQRKVIPLFSERNSKWTWFLNLKAELEDPKVLLHSTMFPDMLASHPHKFSKQLYLNVWDSYVTIPRFDGFYFAATAKTVNKDILYQLRRFLHEITTSYVMIANETTYRFQRNQAFIAIIDNGIESKWYFRANEIVDLKYLIELNAKSELLNLDLKPTITGNNEIEINEKRQILEQFLDNLH